MAIIDPEGLFGGERLAALSDKARLYWPWVYSASNGYARIELNLRAIIRRCFSAFNDPPSEQQLLIIISEYAENYLVFTFENNGQQWIQFDTPDKFLPRHKTKKDAASPGPTEQEREAFKNGYLGWRQAKSLSLHRSHKTRELFPENVRGVGIGEGIGIGSVQAHTTARANPTPPKPEPRLNLLNPLANPEIAGMVDRIAILHPRNQCRSMQASEVPDAHRLAIIKAMKDEMALTDQSAGVCLDMMLTRIAQQAADTPPDRWRYFKEVPNYFALHEYRLESSHFNREDKPNAQSRTANNISERHRARAIRQGRRHTA